MREPLEKLQQIPPEIASLGDYETFARERVSEQAWAYLAGAAGDELTLRDNCAAFQRLRLQSRVLSDMRGAHTRLELFGQTLAHPILVAPVAYQQLAHPEGERATALAAAALQSTMVVSAQASVSLEDVAQAGQGPLWFQLYIQADREFTLQLVQRAEAAGYRALVLTVDAPVNGLRNREQRVGFSLPRGVEAVNLRGMRALPPSVAVAGGSAVFDSPLLNAAPTWDDVRWLQAHTRLPIVLKGIMSAEDAVRAADHGVAGVIVSNHGGRTLDGQPATIDALPAIAQALAGRLPILLDGGIRRGSDVLKALALGASAVLVGRPCINGLATAGASGVAHVLHILRTELELAMVFCGCRTLAEIDASLIWPSRRD